QEHQKEGRLERTTYLDLKLSDDHRRDQGRGDGSQTKTFVGKGPEVISESQGKEDSDLWIAAKRLYEPINHVLALPIATSLLRSSLDPMGARMAVTEFCERLGPHKLQAFLGVVAMDFLHIELAHEVDGF